MAVSGFADTTATTSGGIATYSKSGITAGNYAVIFKFYATDASSGTDIFLGEWIEYAAVASGVTSVSTDTVQNEITSLDSIYSITYNWNGGGLAIDATARGSYTRQNGAALPTEAQVTKTGYTFGGWYESASFSGNEITEIDVGSTGNKTFWAKWTANQYTVTFHKNTNASDNTTATQTLTYDSAQSLSTLSALGWTRSDATFVGWATASTGTTAAKSAENTVNLTDGASAAHNLTATPGGTVDLYAVWKYTITYSGNKGSTSTDVTGSVQSQEVTGWNTSLTLRANGYTHTGYSFIEWNTASGGSGTSYTAETAHTFSKDTTLYAKWSLQSYTIEYTMNGGTNASTNPTSYTVEDSVTLSNPQSRTGYTFGGWYTASDFSGSKVTQIARGSTTGTKHFYAKWTANTYTVTLDANGGSGGTASVTATYGSAMPAITAPTRTGYTFAGFYSTSATTGGTQYYTAASASAKTYTDTSGITLYARWNAVKPTITVKTGWAKSTTTVYITATYGQALPAITTTNAPSDHSSTLGSFKRVGYDLNGFYSAENGGGTKFYNADGTSAYGNCDFVTDKTVYAYWTLKSGYTLLSGSASGKSLSGGNYVVSSDISFTTSTAGGSGITISGTVNTYIEEGCTLTATGTKGADGGTGGSTVTASGTTDGGHSNTNQKSAGGTSGKGGGAGIEVPSGTTLNLYGYGSVNATGGNGGKAGNGGSNVKNAFIHTDGDTSKRDAWGGTGGGGGAGIGTKGANGGTGGEGAAGGYVHKSFSDSNTSKSGANADGNPGGAGSAAGAYGTIKAQSTVTITATGGTGGAKGSGGTYYNETGHPGSSNATAINYRVDDKDSGWNNDWSMGAGGSGGGGGAGYNGAKIGKGGAGGGGGGGGAGGSVRKESGGSRQWSDGKQGNGGSGKTAGDNGSCGVQTDGGWYGEPGAGGAAGSGGDGTSITPSSP